KQLSNCLGRAFGVPGKAPGALPALGAEFGCDADERRPHQRLAAIDQWHCGAQPRRDACLLQQVLERAASAGWRDAHALAAAAAANRDGGGLETPGAHALAAARRHYELAAVLERHALLAVPGHDARLAWRLPAANELDAAAKPAHADRPQLDRGLRIATRGRELTQDLARARMAGRRLARSGEQMAQRIRRARLAERGEPRHRQSAIRARL